MKRQRSEVPAWWTAISEEIRSNGGHVHHYLTFDEASRAQTVTGNVDAGTVLLRIQREDLIAVDRAIILCPWLESKRRTDRGAAIVGRLTNPIADLWIAMALASQRPDRLPYLGSLPESSSYDALPRRWSDDDLRDLLDGTSLYERAGSAKRGAARDYALLKELFETTELDVKHESRDETARIIPIFATPFPPFEIFSDMLAAVSSRAFQIGNTDQGVAMVPLLDLCDHARGADGRKNISYEQQQDGSMLVKSIVALRPGECLKLTYGARGNAQLLLNYGFCIPHNIEPDGSSNDVLEFRIQSSTDVASDTWAVRRPILLRTGPKSYSYGGFAHALEQFFLNGFDDAPSGCSASEIDVQSFLSQCDEEDSEEYDAIYDETGRTEEPDHKSVDDGMIRADNHLDEMNALHCFKMELIRLSESYGSKSAELQNALALKPCPRFYSAILCQSELRTIFFFLRAVDKVQGFLQPGKSSVTEHTFVNCGDDDLSLIEEQTTELANAFIAIRHGALERPLN
jgi:hypothetical protein